MTSKSVQKRINIQQGKPMDAPMTNDIDRQVAEKAMGWWASEKNYFWLGKSDNKCAVAYHGAVKDWHPTSNIEQAMMVVDRVIELGWLINISLIEELRGGLMWFVRFHKNLWYEGVDAKLPAAICEAALKAVE